MKGNTQSQIKESQFKTRNMNQRNSDQQQNSFIHKSKQSKFQISLLWNRFTLHFLNKVVENEYRDSYIKMQRIIFYIIQSFVTFTNLWFSGNNFIVYQNHKIGWIRLITGLIEIIFMIVAFKYQKLTNYFMLISLTIYQVVQLEYFLLIMLDIDDQTSKTFVIYGINTILIPMAIMFFQNSWYYRAYSVLSLEYALVRITGGYTAQTFLPHVLFILMIPIFYLIDMQQREHFYWSYRRNKDLEGWQYLLKDYIPSPVLVCSFQSGNCSINLQNQSTDTSSQNYTIDFINKQCKEDFQIDGIDQMYKKLASITAQSARNNSIIYNKDESNIQNLSNQTEDQIQLTLNQLLQDKAQSVIKEESQQRSQYLLDQNPDNISCFIPGQSRNYNQLTMQTENGVKYFDLKTVELLWNDKPSLMLLITDVSDEVNIQSLLKSDSYKDNLLSSITHNLKTPLNGMMCQIQTMKYQDNRDVERLEYGLSVLEKSAFLLQAQMDDIIDYSQITKGKLRVNVEEIYIQDVCRDVIDLFQIQADDKKLEIKFKSELTLDQECIQNDPKRIKQIFINMIGNSLKFTNKGYISINITWNPIANCIQVSISDSGTGMAPKRLAEIKKVLELNYFQDSSNQTNRRSGFGLGMQICSNISGLIGPKGFNKIQIQSEVDKGSVFTFNISHNLHEYEYYQNQFINQQTRMRIESKRVIEQKKILLNSQKKQWDSGLQITEIHNENSATDIVYQNDSINTENQQKNKNNGININSSPENNNNNEIIIQEDYVPFEENNTYTDVYFGEYSKIIDSQIPLKNKVISSDKNVNKISLKKNKPSLEQQNIVNRPNNTSIFSDKNLNNNNNNKNPPSQIDTNNNHSNDKNNNNSGQNLINNNTNNKNTSNENSSSQIQSNKNIKAIRIVEEQIQELKSIFGTQNRKILVVDDTPFNIMGIKSMFSPFKNLIIEDAFNGQEAIDKIKDLYTKSKDPADNYWFILMDVNMPVLDGIEAIKIIRKLQEQDQLGEQIILSLTAFAQDKDEALCLNAGSDYFLTKPVTYSRILQAMQELNI